LTASNVTTAGQRTRLSVYALVRDGDLVLLTQIAKAIPGDGLWTLPGGGVDWGEHPIDALHRELYEETGLRGTVHDFLGINSHVFAGQPGADGPALHAVRLVYRVAALGDPTVTEVGGSTVDAAWVSPTRLDELPLENLVDWALKKG